MYQWNSQPAHANGHGHHRVADAPGEYHPTFDTGYSQQQAWPVTTSTGVELGQVFVDRPANSGTTEPPYQHSFGHAGMIPTAPVETQYTCGWQSSGWPSGTHAYANSAQTIGTVPASLGPEAARVTSVYSNGYYTPTSTNVQYSAGQSSPLGSIDDRVECPYKCGTVLSGIHAVGNLTRHLKSKACPNSPKSALRHICPVHGCEREYARSDGLKVHMRRHHGAPPAAPKYGVRADDEGEYDAGYDTSYDAGY